MTIANQLTVLRLLLAPVVVICILYGRFGLALGALVLAGLTDAEIRKDLADLLTREPS